MRDPVNIKVYVPSGPKPLLIPKAIVCKASDYFEKALSEKYAEGQDNVFHFDEDKADAVDVFVYWMYNDVLPSFHDKIYDHGYFGLLVHSWILGDKYMAPAFQNLIMEDLCSYAESYPVEDGLETSLISEIWVFTTSDSKLRQFIVEWITASFLEGFCEWDSNETFNSCENLAAEVITTLSNRYRDLENRPPTSPLDGKALMVPDVERD